MSIVFQKLIECADHFKKVLEDNGTLMDEGHSFSWPNYVYTSSSFRRAHLDIVDARETKKLYMMHLCIFPHTNDTSPIYGFDIIAGPNKVTGAFHDFSGKFYSDHAMMKWFSERVRNLEWNKTRTLPEWAQNIFSDSMIAAGNIQDSNELDIILNLAKNTLDYYIENVGYTRVTFDTTAAQDYYCYNQRKNQHTPKVMESLGIDPETTEVFIRDCLFPSASSQEELGNYQRYHP